MIGATGLTELKGVGSDLLEPSEVSTVFKGARPEKSITVICPENPVAIGGGYDASRADIMILTSSPLLSPGPAGASGQLNLMCFGNCEHTLSVPYSNIVRFSVDRTPQRNPYQQ